MSEFCDREKASLTFDWCFLGGSTVFRTLLASMVTYCNFPPKLSALFNCVGCFVGCVALTLEELIVLLLQVIVSVLSIVFGD